MTDLAYFALVDSVFSRNSDEIQIQCVEVLRASEKQVTLKHSCGGSNYRTRIAPANWHRTPEAAVAALKAEAERALESAKSTLARRERQLAAFDRPIAAPVKIER